MTFPKTTHDSATADNATATVTVSPDANESVYLANVSAKFDGTVSNITITVKDATTEVWAETIPDENGDSWDFSIPLKITEGNDLVVELAASGTAGTSGTLHVWYSKGE